MTRILPLLALLAATPAPAQPPLAEFTPVTEGLIAVGMAVALADGCAQVSPRTLRGLLYLNRLKGEARAAGYSAAQIDAFVADAAQKARLEAIARDRLAALGARPGDPASLCAVARAQIATGTQVGRLLNN